MSDSTAIPIDKMIPVTVARRNLGKLLDRLVKEGEFYLMRGGKVAAKLTFPDEIRREERMKILKEVEGAWAGTDLDDDKLWEEVLVKGRINKKPIRL